MPTVETVCLHTDEPGLLRLAASAALGGAGRARQSTFERIYYDTPDRRLARRHLTLCVVCEGRRFRQLLEAGADGGLGAEACGAWEAPLRGPEPTLKAISSLAARERVGLLLAGELESILVVRGTRRTRTLGSGAAVGATISFVAGERLGGGRVEPLAAVEVTAAPTAPAAHLELALALHREVPVRWQTRSEAARCLSAVRGEPPAWQKAQVPKLEVGAPVDDGIASVLFACLAHWRQNEDAALDGRDPEGLHQLRVALRRLSSALSALSEVIPASQRAALREETRWLLGSLGPARDLDVLLTELVAPILAVRSEDPALAQLQGLAQVQRQNAYGRARAAILSPRSTDLMLRLAAWIAARGWRSEGEPGEVHPSAASHGSGPRSAPGAEPDGDTNPAPVSLLALTSRLLRERQRKAKKRGRGFGALGSAERHRLRIALKRLRYAAELFASLYPPEEVRAYLGALKDLQDNLGAMNDLAVAEGRLGELIVGAGDPELKPRLRAAAGLVIGWHSRGLANLEPITVSAWAAFVALPGFAG